MEGVVEAITITDTPDALPDAVQHVRATAGAGLEGEYHHDITLIAAEVIADDPEVPIDHAESRRNVLTRGIDLNALVGRRFRVGTVECVGTELAEPCRRLEKLNSEQRLLRHLAHRAGLRADVVSDGEIAVGDSVTALD
jgi:MOSC domain-containing protein YiiM